MIRSFVVECLLIFVISAGALLWSRHRLAVRLDHFSSTLDSTKKAVDGAAEASKKLDAAMDRLLRSMDETVKKAERYSKEKTR